MSFSSAKVCALTWTVPGMCSLVVCDHIRNLVLRFTTGRPTGFTDAMCMDVHGGDGCTRSRRCRVCGSIHGILCPAVHFDRMGSHDIALCYCNGAGSGFVHIGPPWNLFSPRKKCVLVFLAFSPDLSFWQQGGRVSTWMCQPCAKCKLLEINGPTLRGIIVIWVLMVVSPNPINGDANIGPMAVQAEVLCFAQVGACTCASPK